MKAFLCFLVFSVAAFLSQAQEGCTDPQAQNYNATATANNGSCTYALTSNDLSNTKQLPSALNENSGLCYTNNSLYTFNDGGNAAVFYKINETDGSILQTITVTNATNTDWEAITADDTYFYIGDFGNNENGNRTNLKVYRILKASIGTSTHITVVADVINFTYEDQVIQNPVTTGANATKFDCEAFIVINNVLHLFTKDWIDSRTRHYTLPALPGSYTATAVEEFAVDGLITDASISVNNVIILTGYTTNLSNVFMWMLYDYSGSNFFSGNKRRFELGKTVDLFNRSNDKGQIEGITFTSPTTGYISSEQINRTVSGMPIVVPPNLYNFSVAGFVPLPVKLASFNTIFKTNAIQINWQTAAETNTDYFVLEHSVNNSTFYELAKQKAAGNATTLSAYTFTHNNPEPGNHFYRLKQFDTNGKMTHLGIRAATVSAQKEALYKVFPNPVSNNYFILQAPESAAQNNIYSLLDATGKRIMTGNLTNQRHFFNIEHLPKGLFILKISNGQVIKIEKQ